MKTRNQNHVSVTGNSTQRGKSARLAVAMAIPALALSACYVIPMDQYGRPLDYNGRPIVINQPPAAPTVIQTGGAAPAPAVVYSGSAMPTSLNVRLYPQNEIASQTGVLGGSITNMMTGKGRIQFDYRGEMLAGEATRVDGDDRRGVASAYGPRGTFVSCNYQMSSPLQGAADCTFNNGAKYQAHIGNN
jgi:hypothetical protein